MHRIETDVEKSKLITDKLNEVASRLNPGHGDQGCPLIRAQVAVVGSGKVDIRTHSEMALRGMLYENGITFNERLGKTNGHAHHFTMDQRDFDKLVSNDLAPKNGRKTYKK